MTPEEKARTIYDSMMVEKPSEVQKQMSAAVLGMSSVEYGLFLDELNLLFKQPKMPDEDTQKLIYD